VAVGLPVVGLRLAEGRTGSTLLMQLLATSPAIVFDPRYPAEYRFLSYFARVSEMMTERYDPERHVGVTPFFFSEKPQWGPVPFHSDVADIAALGRPLLAAMWQTFSQHLTTRHPDARFYAEKLALPVEAFVAAGIDLRIIDVVRDPRDMLASIRSFTARGIDGFGRRAGEPEEEYTARFVARLADAFDTMTSTPSGPQRVLVRYEDLASDLHGVAQSLGSWLGVVLDAETVLAQRDQYQHHATTSSTDESIGRWRRDLSAADAALVERALRDPMTAFGYL